MEEPVRRLRDRKPRNYQDFIYGEETDLGEEPSKKRKLKRGLAPGPKKHKIGKVVKRRSKRKLTVARRTTPEERWVRQEEDESGK